ncbi:hypothetical protein FK220_015685 [Flavobacteriaceae bacterium TP-CH-4]|uniref:Uncharacterized protein n=1 Tax=Pelagihabitans pacificus TaxID=2696054 RepID=A0A967EC11_9FLAO|nr:hypothetical protein [Pelagihabitans pacificus]NHF60796.1 hypothetical protein [Pelagihabitans pacificus]
MKKYLLALSLITGILTGFTTIDEGNAQEPPIPEKIANANGFENWPKVKEIKFTFNVDRDTTHFERSWIWNPRTNDITATTAESTLEYNWADMDSTAYRTNAGFINDKYWLLAPYQLVWDGDNITYEHQAAVEAPISKNKMQKLTIVYGNEGGYTPGDAYDFYFGDDLIVQEWVFRKANQSEPSMITTWEDYQEINGLKLATMHKMPNSKFKLYFTGVEVTTD